MAFDAALVQNGSETETLTPEEFHAIALETRVEMLCQGRVRFVVGDRQVPADEALRRNERKAS